MAYDRYVAICLPLHYHRILNQRNCILITIGIWAAAFINSLVYIITAVYMSSCHSNIIHQFFCDAKSLTTMTCTTSPMFFILNGIETLILAVTPLICIIISYANIFSVIFKMTSQESRKKSFSTCSSHITIISTYYGTLLIGYFIPPYSEVLDTVFSVVYTSIIPMINPIIYSLQNAAVQSALLRLLRGMCSFKRNSGHKHQ
ncbi:olfactory receptor 1C1-like [Leptodactylus fuscus]|uniref:olfactory receptor 1C1-like n=1 Tax=Leptodactylus fuscus TaxID=238119 RepID=UPI003F4E8933